MDGNDLDMFVNLINEDYIESKITASVTKLSRRSCSASQKANRHEAKWIKNCVGYSAERSVGVVDCAAVGKTHPLATFTRARERGKR